MPTIGTVALVQARLTYETISAASNPTETQISGAGGFIDQVEARLEGALIASELPILSQYTAATRPYYLLADLITTGVVGMVKEAWETAKGELTDRAQEIVWFEAQLTDIAQFPSKWGAMLNVSGSPPTASITLRAHTNDTTVLADYDSGEIDPPTFTIRSDPEAQF